MRRFWSTSLVGILLACLVPVLVPSSALACDCDIVTRQELLAEAQVLFVGTPVSSVPSEQPNGWGGFREPIWTVEVDSVYRGSVTRTVEVDTSGGCGVTVEGGLPHVIAAEVLKGKLRAHGCGATGFLRDFTPAELATIGTSSTPQPNTAPPSTPTAAPPSTTTRPPTSTAPPPSPEPTTSNPEPPAVASSAAAAPTGFWTGTTIAVATLLVLAVGLIVLRQVRRHRRV